MHVATEQGFVGLPRHRRIARDLGIDRWKAAAWELHIRDLCLRFADDGELSKHFQPEDLADELEWQGEVRRLMRALYKHGVLLSPYKVDVTPQCWSDTENGRFVSLRAADRRRKARRREGPDQDPEAEQEDKPEAEAPPARRPRRTRKAPADTEPEEPPQAPAARKEPEPPPKEQDDELFKQLVAAAPNAEGGPRLRAIWSRMDVKTKKHAIRAREHLFKVKWKTPRWTPNLGRWVREEGWLAVSEDTFKKKPKPKVKKGGKTPEEDPEEAARRAKNAEMFALRMEIKEKLKASGKKFRSSTELEEAIDDAMSNVESLQSRKAAAQ